VSNLAPLAFAFSLPVPVIAGAAAVDTMAVMAFQTLWQTTVQRHRDRISRAISYDYVGSLIAFPVGLALAGPAAG
jgi:hypothetical protein